MALLDRFRSAWNAFYSYEKDPPDISYASSGYGGRPYDYGRVPRGDKSIVTAIFNRLAVDVASYDIWHIATDSERRYTDTIKSGLQECLTVEANIDQTARAFRQDIAMTMFDHGCAVIVPVDTTMNPASSGNFDIRSVRVGEIVQYYPRHIRVSLYNDQPDKGLREEIVVPKNTVAIVDNPFYSTMNGPNSTLRRLMRKLELLDYVDELSNSGKLDILIQVPYTVKSELRRAEASRRLQMIEDQLHDSKHGIAYIDGVEKVVQLNRPVESTLLPQVEYLTNMLYDQLGITKEILNGTATEMVMHNYLSRTIEPVVCSIADAMRRTFLTKTARTRGQDIAVFSRPFRILPPSELANVADKFTRNEVMTSNELRQIVGLKPVADPRADQLRNSNMPQDDLGISDPNQQPTSVYPDDSPEGSQNGSQFE